MSSQADMFSPYQELFSKAFSRNINDAKVTQLISLDYAALSENKTLSMMQDAYKHNSKMKFLIELSPFQLSIYHLVIYSMNL